MEIKTTENFETALKTNGFTDLGCYPLYFMTSDGGLLSFKSAVQNAELIKDAIKDNDNSGWRVCACDVNWESILYCDHSGKQIESAYEPIED
jgi:hypothetical protein